MICNGCHGVVGRDCFNPSECEWITRDMEQRQARGEGEIVHVPGGYVFQAFDKPPLMQVNQTGEVRPVFEVTDEMVERAAKALDEWSHGPTRDMARAALTAAFQDSHGPQEDR